MSIKHTLGILCVAALALIAAGCHSGGGSGDSSAASAADAADPYAGTWAGYMQVPDTGPQNDLSVTLVSLGNQQYKGTATTTVGGTTHTGTLTGSYTTVTTTLPHLSLTIKWDGDYGQSVLDGDIHEQETKYYITGDVEQFGESFDTGGFGMSHDK